ncbi:tig [Symbiodinium sp. CCMP2456]|nr:tig [Symbiodinium sp. CCMP2456]
MAAKPGLEVCCWPLLFKQIAAWTRCAGLRTQEMDMQQQRRSASEGRNTASKWYRSVTPHVHSQDRDSLDDWRRAYDNRFMVTSLQYMHRHVGDCVDQVYRTHAEKQDYFRQHQLPNLTWMDLHMMTHDRSLRQRQPAYYGDVGGPPRIGVLAKRQATPLANRILQPKLNLGSKALRGYGSNFGK